MLRCRVRVLDGVISTDDIIPGRYKHMHVDPAKLSEHVFEDHGPGFAETIRPGDALWSNDTFGIGSSREQAATSLVAAGVVAVIAPEFGRIFYRNAWNVGLRLIAVPRPPGAQLEKTPLEIDIQGATLTSVAGVFAFAKPPQRLEDIVAAGGLLEWVKSRPVRLQETA